MTIKKIVIPKDSLPPINAEIDGYAVRYRLISEDRNQYSHWSPVQIVKPNFYYSKNLFSIVKHSTYISLIWDPVKTKLSSNSEYSNNADLVSVERQYDIWIRWSKADLGDWFYLGRVEGNSTNVIIPDYYYFNSVKIDDKPNQVMAEIRQVASPISREYIPGLFYASALESV